jgi:RecA-family ATPase
MNGAGAGKKEQPASSLVLIDPRTLMHVPVPERVWIVDQWLPVGHVTLNYADGSVGKTLLAQHLMTSCATAKPWCGLAVTRCRSIGFFCEDDRDEIHRRQNCINEALGITYDDLGDTRWICAVGDDNVLVRFDRDGLPLLTERFEMIKAASIAFGAKLVVIDTAADTFGGNENDRAQVRAFLGFVLNGLARAINGAVLLNAHPSRAGMANSGDMDGGSTAWSNTARSRWAMTRPIAEDGEEVDPDIRILSRRKANYAAREAEIKLRWDHGALVPLGASRDRFTAAASEADARDLFLVLLDRCDEINMPVTSSKNAGNYAPRVFAKRTDRLGRTVRDFEAAMGALFTSGHLALVNYGRPGDERRRIARRAAEPGEQETAA